MGYSFRIETKEDSRPGAAVDREFIRAEGKQETSLQATQSTQPRLVCIRVVGRLHDANQIETSATKLPFGDETRKIPL